MRIEITLKFSSYMRLIFSSAIGLGLLNAIIGLMSFKPAATQASSLTSDISAMISIYLMGAGIGFASGVAFVIAGGLVSFPIYSWLSKKGFFSVLEGTPIKESE